MRTSDYLELPDDSVAEIASVFHGTPPRTQYSQLERNAFFKACKLVAESNQIEVTAITSLSVTGKDIELLENIANRANFRYRQIALTGNWWRRDHGPLLVFKRDGHKACAVVPDYRGRYHLVEPFAEGKDVISPISSDFAALLDAYAYCFYKPLPDTRLDWKDLLKYGLIGMGNDIKRLLFVMTASGLLSWVLPVSIGIIFDDVIPNANFDLLGQFIIALAIVSVSMTIFYTAEFITTTRLELKMNVSLQAAVWDRLLRLPTSFFRKYASGDLSDRASGIDEIQQTITGGFITSVLAGVFSVFSLALMFYYDYRLALGAVFLTFLFVGINVIAAVRQVLYQREMQRVQGENYGFLIQILTGITKLRIANKTRTAFTLWLGKFIRTTQLFLRSETIQIQLIVFGAVYSVVVTASLFAMVVAIGADLTLGNFMAFNAVYGQFFFSMIALAGVITGSLEIVPLYERAKPILDTSPEYASSGLQVTDLEGKINIDHVSFCYASENDHVGNRASSMVLKDIDIEISPGAFIALTGPSGSGKSTLFRLLLGFDRPTVGTIRFDGKNLQDLNLRSLRRQIGVVLQNSMVMPGTVLENILYGLEGLTEDDAWAAAQLACINDDIDSMPMGMHTFVAETGKNFSAGQRQRILLARAFARHPKILFLDEATSALDNVTQARIIDHIVNSRLTCIISAHRLSTVEAADRIFVLDKGQVVQQGNYSELVGESGMFSRMSKRQVL